MSEEPLVKHRMGAFIHAAPQCVPGNLNPDSSGQQSTWECCVPQADGRFLCIHRTDPNTPPADPAYAKAISGSSCASQSAPSSNPTETAAVDTEVDTFAPRALNQRLSGPAVDRYEHFGPRCTDKDHQNTACDGYADPFQTCVLQNSGSYYCYHSISQ